MSAFDHVITLLSFVFALAMAHLLSRAAALIIERERVRFSGLLSLAMLNAVVITFTNWLEIWDLRGVGQWDLASIMTLFAFSIVLYFLCAVIAPERSPEGTIDMEAYYERQRVPYYCLVFLCMILAIASNTIFLKTPNVALFFEENAATLPFFVPGILALAIPARWAQWIAGVLLLSLTVVFAAVFSGVLH